MSIKKYKRQIKKYLENNNLIILFFVGTGIFIKKKNLIKNLIINCEELLLKFSHNDKFQNENFAIFITYFQFKLD